MGPHYLFSSGTRCHWGLSDHNIYTHTHTHTHIYSRSYIYILSSDLSTIQLAPDLLEANYCIRREVYVQVLRRLLMVAGFRIIVGTTVEIVKKNPPGVQWYRVAVTQNSQITVECKTEVWCQHRNHGQLANFK